MKDGVEKRAAIFIGPGFGTVQRADLVAAAREAGDAAFDVLIACAFNYEAHATEFAAALCRDAATPTSVVSVRPQKRKATPHGPRAVDRGPCTTAPPPPPAKKSEMPP